MYSNVVTKDSDIFKDIVHIIDTAHFELESVLEIDFVPKDEWINDEKVMKILSISKRTLATYKKTGVIKFSSLGNKIYYKMTDVYQLLEDCYNK